MNAIMHADNCTDSDLFDEGCWLALHASLLQDAEDAKRYRFMRDDDATWEYCEYVHRLR